MASFEKFLGLKFSCDEPLRRKISINDILLFIAFATVLTLIEIFVYL